MSKDILNLLRSAVKNWLVMHNSFQNLFGNNARTSHADNTNQAVKRKQPDNAGQDKSEAQKDAEYYCCD